MREMKCEEREKKKKIKKESEIEEKLLSCFAKKKRKVYKNEYLR